MFACNDMKVRIAVALGGKRFSWIHDVHHFLVFLDHPLLVKVVVAI